MSCEHEIERNHLRPGWICGICGEPFVEQSELRALQSRLADAEDAINVWKREARASHKEVEVLRLYGNKDCTAMADKELSRPEEGWIRHDSMRSSKTSIVDDRGHRIDMVRGYRQEPAGLRIRALHPVDGGKKCVLAGDDVVEFEAFVLGARVVDDRSDDDYSSM